MIVPASPALVIAGGADAAGANLRGEITGILSRYTEPRIHLVGSRDDRWRTRHRGSFAAWGAPEIRVGEGNHLPELVQRFLLGPDAQDRVVDVRGELGTPSPGVLTIIAIDGSAGLTARAPLALVDGAEVADTWCRAVLQGKVPAPENADRLRTRGIIEPGLWMELAEIRPLRAKLFAADTTLGVGRYVAEWEVPA